MSEIRSSRELLAALRVSRLDGKVLAVRTGSQNAPMVCLVWTHPSVAPAPRNCWVLDVTTGNPASDVKHWVIANRVIENVFRKIGSMVLSAVISI
jgi:hypothetical protein